MVVSRQHGEIPVQRVYVCVCVVRMLSGRAYTTLKMSSLSVLLQLIFLPLTARGWGEYS